MLFSIRSLLFSPAPAEKRVVQAVCMWYNKGNHDGGPAYEQRLSEAGGLRGAPLSSV